MSYARGNFRIMNRPDGEKYIVGPSGDQVLDWDMHGAPIYGYDDFKRPICFAMSHDNQSGVVTRCQSIKRDTTFGRCRRHSVLQRQGARGYAGKSMAKTLPTSMNADFERIMSDPDLLSMREDIGVMEIRLNQLYADLEKEVDPEIWDALQSLGKRAENLLRTGGALDNPKAMDVCMREMVEVIKQGGKGSGIWDEIIKVTEAKGKFVKQEQQYLVLQAGMVTKEQVAAMVTMLVRSIQDEIALAIPGPFGEELNDNIALRIAGYLTGTPTRPNIRVEQGIPLQLVEIQPGDAIDGSKRGNWAGTNGNGYSR